MMPTINSPTFFCEEGNVVRPCAKRVEARAKEAGREGWASETPQQPRATRPRWTAVTDTILINRDRLNDARERRASSQTETKRRAGMMQRDDTQSEGQQLGIKATPPSHGWADAHGVSPQVDHRATGIPLAQPYQGKHPPQQKKTEPHDLPHNTVGTNLPTARSTAACIYPEITFTFRPQEGEPPAPSSYDREVGRSGEDGDSGGGRSPPKILPAPPPPCRHASPPPPGPASSSLPIPTAVAAAATAVEDAARRAWAVSRRRARSSACAQGRDSACSMSWPVSCRS